MHEMILKYLWTVHISLLGRGHTIYSIKIDSIKSSNLLIIEGSQNQGSSDGRNKAAIVYKDACANEELPEECGSSSRLFIFSMSTS